MNPSMLEGKVALITGASRGIGMACLEALGQCGATVIGTATSDQGAQSIAQAIEAKSLKGVGRVLDVIDKAQAKQLVDEVTNELGAPTILVNNAGVTQDNLMLRMKEQEWNEVIETNLTGVFHLTQLHLKGMMKARWGRIINISSVVGLTGNPGQANYAAAKAGVIAMSKSLAQEVATRGITVNAVAPGFIETDMTRKLNEKQREQIMQNIPMQRLGETSDIANAVAFLASEYARYITGETLNVNGGMVMD